MSIFNDVCALVRSAPVYPGYPPTDAAVPYVAGRPFVINPDGHTLEGDAVAWDFSFSFYCAAGSVEASYNLAVMVLQDVSGKAVGGTTLSASMSYVGAQVEGHYESLVIAQLNQGGIS